MKITHKNCSKNSLILKDVIDPLNNYMIATQNSIIYRNFYIYINFNYNWINSKKKIQNTF